jgi:hypothetical protein
MRRMDLYSTIHKGLRRALFTVAGTIARTDFGDAAQAERAQKSTRLLLEALDEHAHQEDRVLMPAIEKVGPAVFAELQADHSRVGGLQREMEQLLDRFATATADERLSLGQRLHEKMGRLVGEHMFHMDREETTANRLLQAHYSDEELKALHVEILRGIPAERLCQMAEIMLPAVTAQEQRAVLAGLQAVLPPELFPRVQAAASDSGAQLDAGALLERMSA